jgi:AcrR family transcriptional regulator
MSGDLKVTGRTSRTANGSDSRTKVANRALILAAAPIVLRRTGLMAFGLPEVAREAGLARQTIYNHFEGRDDLLAALLIKEMIDRHAPMQHELGQREPTVDNFICILLAELEAGRGYALFDDMLSPSSGPRVAELVFSCRPVMDAREAAWLPILERYEGAGLLREGLDSHELVRWLTWQVFWVMTNPGTLCGDSPSELAGYFRTYLIPGILRTEARALAAG